MSHLLRSCLPGLIVLIVATGTIRSQSQVPTRPAASPGTGLIAGQIIDADTGRGVPGAVVSLGPSVPPPAPVGELLEVRPPQIPTGAAARSVLATADGRFVFSGLAKGRFTLGASAPGYVYGAYGQGRLQGPGLTIDLDEAQVVGNASVRVWKLGTISGRLSDENGDPAVGIAVRCVRRAITGGQKRLTTAATSYTDDRGIYRAANLIPGDYLCGNELSLSTMPISVAEVSEAASASGNPNGSEAYRTMQASGNTLSLANGVRVGSLVLTNGGVSIGRGLMPPPPDANGRMTAYSQVYYPSATSTSQATMITVKPGEDRTGIDMRLRLVAAPRISGRVIGPGGPAPFLAITLVPETGSDFGSEGEATVGRTVSDASGNFIFLGIPSGSYSLKIRMFPRPPAGSGATPPAPPDPSLWASVPVTVGDADIGDLVVTLRTGVRVTGRVEFNGAKPQPSAAELGRVGIRLQSAEGRTSAPTAIEGRPASDGTFQTSGYPAGRYIASVLANSVPAGWTLRSIVANGRDISVDPVELIDTDIAGAVVTFTDRATELSGTVTGPNGPDPNAEVVVFPADSMAWKEIGVVFRRSRNERVSQGGAFVIAGLPPGEYFVAAVSHSVPGDRQDPAFLNSLVTAATRVTLNDGGKAAIQLTTRTR